MSDINEVVIVGSGPAGYTAAIYAARAQLKPIIYEGSVTAGGALMNTTEVENFPGFADGVMGPELMESMRKQVERFDAKIITEDIVSMKLTGDIKELTDESGNQITSFDLSFKMYDTFVQPVLKIPVRDDDIAKHNSVSESIASIETLYSGSNGHLY